MNNKSWRDISKSLSEDKSYITLVTKNAEAEHFGYWTQKKDMSEYLQYLDRTFHHVHVYELMDESLVILRRKLQWSMKDILLLQMREGNYNRNAIKGEIMEEIKADAHYDYQVYEFFTNRLKREISEQDDDFNDEVEVYRGAKSTVTQFCDNLCAQLKANNVKSNAAHNKTNRTSVIEMLETSTQIDVKCFGPAIRLSGYDCLRMMINPRVYRAMFRYPSPVDYLLDQLPWTILEHPRAFNLYPCF